MTLFALAAAMAVACGAQSDLDPLRVQNSSTLAVSLVVNGRTIRSIPPVSDPVEVAPTELGAAPWLISIQTPAGRELLGTTFPTGTVTRTTGPDGHSIINGEGGRIDLSCGRIDVWVGPQPGGPMPGPGVPGDCDS